MPYTKVSKPSGGSYTKLFPQGGEAFDDVDADFDSSTVYFDGRNINAWTKVARPTVTYQVIEVGMVAGLLIPLTYCKSYSNIGSPYIKVNKPT